MRRQLGYIKEKEKGVWIIKAPLGRDSAGKYRYKWETLRGSQKQVEKRLGDIVHQAGTGALAMPNKLTVGAYLDNWLRDYCAANVSPTTAQTYAFMVEKHIKPALGTLPLTKLKPEHLQKLYSDKQANGRRDGTGGLSGRSVKYIHQTLHKSLKSAVKMGLLVRNPADNVDIPKVDRHEMATMNESEIHYFLEMARDTGYYPLFYLALFTGARRSELLALKWSDVDLLLCQLSINRTIHQLHNGQVIYREPKTSSSRRMIALSPSTVQVLREHRAEQEKLRSALGLTTTDDALVFSQYDDNEFKPMHPDSISQAWRHLARRIGLTGIHFHSARHSHATLLLKQNVHPLVVAKRLGHSSIKVTLDVYSHVSPGLQERAAQQFDDIVVQPSKKDSCK